MKKFLYHMLKESCGTKWLYEDTVNNLIAYVEHVTGLKCPANKRRLIYEFKRTLQLTRETTT